MSVYVYIIESLKDRSYYIGSSEDPYKRLDNHNSGISKYTSKKMPWKLVYYEEHEDINKARKREHFLKRQKNREFYKKLIIKFQRDLEL